MCPRRPFARYIPTNSKQAGQPLGLTCLFCVCVARLYRVGAHNNLFQSAIFALWWQRKGRICTLHRFLYILRVAFFTLRLSRWLPVQVHFSISQRRSFTKQHIIKVGSIDPSFLSIGFLGQDISVRLKSVRSRGLAAPLPYRWARSDWRLEVKRRTEMARRMMPKNLRIR